MASETAWRVISLLTGVLLTLGMGITYAFGTYSVAMKKQLNYTETNINTVTSIGNLGSFLGAIPIGLFYDRFGPRPTTAVAAVLLFGGLFLMHEAMLDHVPRSPVLIGLYYGTVTLGTSCGVFSAIVVNTKNWLPQHRGKVSGAVFAGYGISAALISALYDLAFVKNHSEPDLVGFFLTMAIILGSLAIIASIFMQPVPLPAEEAESRPLLREEQKNAPVEPSTGRVGLYGVVGGLKLLVTPQFYFILFSFSFTVSVGYLFITTVGSVHKAWKITELDTATLVTVLSLANLSGRIIMGGVVDFVQKKMPVSIAITVPHTIIMLSLIALAFLDHFLTLIICTITIAVAYGASWPAYNVLLNYYFGDKHHGSNMGAITASGISSAGLAIIAGKLYDAHVPPNDPDHQCYGIECYKTTYLIAAGLMLINLGIGIALAVTESRKRKAAQPTIIVN
jgi:MFS family permease